MDKSPPRFEGPKPLFEIYYWSRGRIAPVLPSQIPKRSKVKGALRRDKSAFKSAGLQKLGNAGSELRPPEA